MIIKIKFITAFALFILLVSSAQAQVYTLETCKQMAVENNAKTKNSALDIEAARQKKKEVFTKYFPSISASGMAFKANDPLIETAVTIPNLGTLPVGLVDDGLIAMATAIQPVFAGGKIINGNQLAQIAVDAAELQNNLSKEEVLQKTETYYWQIVSIKEYLFTLNSVDTLLACIHKDVSKAVEVGVVSNNDLLKVELEQNEIESSRLKLDNLLVLSKMLLAQYIGSPMDSLQCMDVAYFETERKDLLSYYITNEESLDRLSSYKLLDKNIEAAKLQTRMKCGEYLPKVGVGYTYMNEDLIDKHTNHGVVFATVSVPVTDWWGGSHAIKKKKIAECQAQNEKDDLSGQLILKMQQSWNSLMEAEKQISLAEKAVAQASENVRMNRDFYNVGTAPVSYLLDAQTLYRQSCNRLTSAQINFKLKLSEYLFATGRGL
ncbi:TolC family protein [Marinilabiliaceae bacterium JC017]|nr:TolC family protein [Marinilabiliaceae bacterium JC017]